MAYTTAIAIQAKIPSPILDDALDDDGDGVRDVGLLDQIIVNASDAVDAMLSNRMECPIADPPAPVRNAALWFAIEEIYGRRQKDLPKNFATAIATARKWLEAIRDGKQILDSKVPIALAASAGGATYVPGRVTAQSADGLQYAKPTSDGKLMLWNTALGRWCIVQIIGDPPQLVWDVEGAIN